jgi:hypothetical protein
VSRQRLQSLWLEGLVLPNFGNSYLSTEKRKNGVSPMARTAEQLRAGNSAQNSASILKKKPRGKPFEKGNQYAFKSDDERINREGRPKGTTMKEMLRREVNRIVPGPDGKPNDKGIVRGNLITNQVVARAIAGDMRATAIVFQFDQDRPNGIVQGETIPGTSVNVNVNANAEAHAHAQVAVVQEKGHGQLVSHLCEIYGLDIRARNQVGARFSNNGNGSNGSNGTGAAANG